jgi:hypothetical protein
MTFYSQSAPSKYSFSNASMVYNEDGIQIHRDEVRKEIKKEKRAEHQEKMVKEPSK